MDLDQGTVSLDENKTNDARTWKLAPGTLAALRVWRKLHPEATPLDLVFPSPSGEAYKHYETAERFRQALKTAGITSHELFEDGKNRRKIRAYDLRGTFVTLALGSGSNEAWVADRTGHRSSQMIARYRRRARLATELELGWLRVLHELVPEIAKHAQQADQVERVRVEVSDSECPVNAPRVRVEQFGSVPTNDEDLNDVAEVSVVGHEGLASGRPHGSRSTARVQPPRHASHMCSESG